MKREYRVCQVCGGRTFYEEHLSGATPATTGCAPLIRLIALMRFTVLRLVCEGCATPHEMVVLSHREEAQGFGRVA